ncbi:MAG: hypothetical protein RDU20_12655 [Desulfomonilaceae bacterium]|nr:hypothetical protein [Desulfomonilaceae bacterium]
MDAGALLSQEEVLRLVTLREVFGGFAHEIAQPLNAIMIASQVVQLSVQRSLLADEEKSFLTDRLGIVSSQVQRATHIVETVRGFSQPKSLVSGKRDLKTSFQSVYGLMGQQFVGHGVKLKWECQDPLPPLSMDPHLAELVLVQGLAFARSSVEAVGERHEEKGMSFDRQVEVRLWSEQGRSVASITWNAGEFPNRIVLMDPSTHAGLLSAGAVLESVGGILETPARKVVMTFP